MRMHLRENRISPNQNIVSAGLPDRELLIDPLITLNDFQIEESDIECI